MSFYRSFIAAVAAMGLATAVCAEETMTNAAAPAAKTEATASQPAAMPTAMPSAMTTAEATTTEAIKTEAPAADAAKLDINKASAKELVKLKGLNPTKAKAIVAFRKKHGDFKSLDELKDVKGFKKLDEKTMKDIQDQLTIG